MNPTNPDEWLKSWCNRYSNGSCQSRACLMRGGYTGAGPVDYDVATCEAHELLVKMQELKATNARLRAALLGLVTGSPTAEENREELLEMDKMFDGGSALPDSLKEAATVARTAIRVLLETS